MRMVFAAWARDSRGRAVTAPAAAPVASSWRRPSGIVIVLSRVPVLAANQRAAALGERPEGLLGRRGLQQLVVVPRRLALARRLHLEEVGGMDLPAVGADGPGAEAVVIR